MDSAVAATFQAQESRMGYPGMGASSSSAHRAFHHASPLRRYATEIPDMRHPRSARSAALVTWPLTACLLAGAACSSSDTGEDTAAAGSGSSSSIVTAGAPGTSSASSSASDAVGSSSERPTTTGNTSGSGDTGAIAPGTSSPAATSAPAATSSPAAAPGPGPSGEVSGNGDAPSSENTGGTGMTAEGTAGSGGDTASEGTGGAGGAGATGDGDTTGGAGGTDGTDGEPEFRSSGCDSDGPPLAEGVHSFELDGNNRRYTVRLPANYDQSRPWPLVLALHPNGGDVGYWDATSGSRNVRGHLQDDAVIIIAEALGGNWRDYEAPESEWPGRVDMELRYFDRVIGDTAAQLCIDQSAIFAMGFSGGGSFSGVLGCRRADIRAFAAGGSVIYFDPSQCTGNAAAWIALSEEDDTQDRRAYLDFFAERAGCDAANFQEPTCHEYQGCAPESPVVFCHYPGGHDWPAFGVEDAWTFFSGFVQR